MPHSEYWPFGTNLDFNAEPSLLQKQLGLMEGEVREIQAELAALRRDRQDRLDLRSRDHQPPELEPDEVVTKHQELELSQNPQVQISTLREQLIRAKNAADEERFQREKYEARLRDLEKKLSSLCGSGMVPERPEERQERQSRLAVEQEVAALRGQLRELADENDELRAAAADRSDQLEDYRAKYLTAQQQVEEMRRQMELMEYDNRQVSDQIQQEIHKMKSQFQEKLGELAPLPELLAGARAQLLQARQLQALAEDGAAHLANETRQLNQKLVAAVNSLNQEKAERSKLQEENQRLKLTVEEQRTEMEELSRSIDEYKCGVVRLQEKVAQQAALYEEKSGECARAAGELAAARAAGARAAARARDRHDAARRQLLATVAELERQLVSSRAHARSAMKDRDEIRQRMQIQINSLQESFELSEIRLRALQNQVSSLKNSYSLILVEDEETADSNKIATP